MNFGPVFSPLASWVNGTGKNLIVYLIGIFALLKGMEFALQWLGGWVRRRIPGHQMEFWKDYKGD